MRSIALGVYWVDGIFLAGRGEHHVEKVFGVAQVVARCVERLADAVLVRHGGNGRYLGDQPHGADDAVFFFFDVHVVVIEGRQPAGHAAQHRHRVRVAAKSP